MGRLSALTPPCRAEVIVVLRLASVPLPCSRFLDVTQRSPKHRCVTSKKRLQGKLVADQPFRSLMLE